MIDYSKIAAKIDDVANKLQEMGYTKEAEQLDMVANSVEALELEAGWLPKFLGGLGISLAMLGNLSPAQAEKAEDRWQKFSPQQVEQLKKSDPKSYDALQYAIQNAKHTPAKAMGGPQMTGEEREVADRSIYTNPQKGPGEMELIKYKKGPGQSIGEAPSPGGAGGGSGQDYFQQHGNYIPQGK